MSIGAGFAPDDDVDDEIDNIAISLLREKIMEMYLSACILRAGRN